MPGTAPQRIYLQDYRPPPFLVEQVDLEFDLDAGLTEVHARLRVKHNPECGMPDAPLELWGKEAELVELTLDGERLLEEDYLVGDEGLVLETVPETCVLGIRTRIKPAENHSGLGMFVADGVLATQCEAEGFRKLTFFPDRPDVLSRYTVRLNGDRKSYPVLLSNGNLVDQGSDGDRHWAVWEDPFPKPSYIFAVVAGQLGCLRDRFVTGSGREIDLAIYARSDLVEKCRFAMGALQRAMRWEEAVYGLECDLDNYNVVALNEYTGAMENKGLNIYDAAGIIAAPDVTTDNDYQLIERIIGHEYFHNWTGNRITCRDWFQLSLKEGLTRFRDQEFARAMAGTTTGRIDTVRRLRTDQFAEDQGPNAHCVQPDSYIEIQNFYTPTVYDKGAELVRMICTLLGKERYFAGIALYVKRHDGQAVTIEDFLSAMEDAAGRDLAVFRRWYHQAGTPRVDLSVRFDPDGKRLLLTARQHCEPSPGQADKAPFHIPLAVGLLDEEGRELPVDLEGEEPESAPETRVLELTRTEQTFCMRGLDKRPVLSVLRDFSAPVEVGIERDVSELAFLMRHDSDGFSRWEATHELWLRSIHDFLRSLSQGSMEIDVAILSNAIGSLFADVAAGATDQALAAHLLMAPEEPVITAGLNAIDMDQVDRARRAVTRSVAGMLRDEIHDAYQRLAPAGPYAPDAFGIARRRLRHACLEYLAALGESASGELCLAHIRAADNMTDALGGLTVISHVDCPEREQAFTEFHERWCADPLVRNKWYFAHAASRVPGVIDTVKALLSAPEFNLHDPSQGMNLLGGFFRRNYVQFHHCSGSGYRFLADMLLKMDRFRPDACAWLMPQIMQWRRHEPLRRKLMKEQLERITDTEGISRGLFELAGNALKDK